MQDLNDLVASDRWIITDARDINDHGQIVAHARDKKDNGLKLFCSRHLKNNVDLVVKMVSVDREIFFSQKGRHIGRSYCGYLTAPRS